MPWLAVLVLLAAPTVGGLLQMALSRTREFDADLEAAILTGDPDGLASALTKLEQAQSRLWEGLVLPGGRIPDPSILRTHPVTADRVARLMALKAAPGGPDSAGHGAPTPRQPRPSLVPKIRAPARPASLNDDWPGTPPVAALMAVPVPQSDELIDDSEPACDRPPQRARGRAAPAPAARRCLVVAARDQACRSITATFMRVLSLKPIDS